MVYAFGIGEVPISVSGRAGTGDVLHTVRAVGAVTRAFHAARPGDVLGLRGPFGVGWGLPAPEGSDLVIVAGGIGLAPLRPVVAHVLLRELGSSEVDIGRLFRTFNAAAPAFTGDGP